MDRGGVGEAWVAGRGGGSVMVFAHEFAGNRGYNGGMGVYTMFCTRARMRVLRRLSVYSLRNPLSSQSQSPPHPSSKIQATHPIPLTLQPTLFFPRIPSIKSPLFLPSPSKTRNPGTAYLSLDQPHHQKSPFHCLLPSTHLSKPFLNSLFPDPAPSPPSPLTFPRLPLL